MLERITIHRLFGRYNYDIDLENGSSFKGLLYLTGPNGMGKTTIFRMINSLYKTNFEYFFSVPYDTISFRFKNGYAIELTQYRKREVVDIDSDEPIEDTISILCKFIRKKESGNDEFSWQLYEESLEKTKQRELSVLMQFLLSDNCFYLSDDRLNLFEIEKFDDSSVNPILIGKLLKKIQQSLIDNYYIDAEFPKQDIKENRIASIKKQLILLRRFGIFMTDWEKKLGSHDNEDLSLFIHKCDSALSSCKNEISLVSEFLTMMDKASFVDKEIVLSPEYGYRFRMKDTSMFVDFKKLSSGEKQYFCLMYDLFFSVQEGNLVLLDEPEISFHLMWQMSFCKQMKALVKLRKLNLLIATHSTEMFDGDFSLTSDLFKQQKQ